MPAFRLLCTMAAFVLALGGGAASAGPAELEPRGEGPYRVACSNVEQDYARAEASVSSYWEGSREQRSRYLTDLLVDPQHAVRYTVRPPDDRQLFGNFRTRAVEFVALVCYPTPEDNPRAPFVLPGGDSVPAMQRGGEAPMFEEACGDAGGSGCAPRRWPVLLYSHGLGGSPLTSGYLETLLRFASHGYVVAAPFHADPRFSRIAIQDFGDVGYLLSRQEEVAEMQAMRPLAIRGLIDTLLAHPDYAARIDPQRIAGFGASMGGETMMLVAGAELTYDLYRFRSRRVLHDPRVRAVVTFVPYSGVGILPAFGEDQRGARHVDVPYLGIVGTDDGIAPRHATEKALGQRRGTRYLIAVEGMGHGSNPVFMDEAYGWYLSFLDANLNGDREALSRLYRATRVAGGENDYVEFAEQSAVAALPAETVVREFHHASLNHFFLTADEAEAEGLLAHPEYGWLPTGQAFAADRADGAHDALRPVCRFYGDPVIGPNSHFYTASAAECKMLLDLERRTPPGQPAWHLESIAFATHVPNSADDCPDAAPFAVLRAYNGHAGEVMDGVRLDANHRYATAFDVLGSGTSVGWRYEGVAFCSAAPVYLPAGG